MLEIYSEISGNYTDQVINPCNFLRDKEAEVHGGNVKETQVTCGQGRTRSHISRLSVLVFGLGGELNYNSASTLASSYLSK